MAIVRITSRTSVPSEALDTIGYIAGRQNSRGQRQDRELFTENGHFITKEEASELIANASAGTTFFRTVISPDPVREDTNRDLNLKTLTEVTMIKLQERYKNMNIQYFGAIHDDHTDNRHVHLIAFIQKRRLTRADLRSLIRSATVEALYQRRLLDRQQPRRAHRHGPKQTRSVQAEFPHTAPMRIGDASAPPRTRAVRIPKVRYACPNCGYGSASLFKVGGKLQCPDCGFKTSRGYQGLSNQSGWGLSLGHTKKREEVGDS